ncbi:unnamed protein product [Brugia pahangi]|nr:unnamed protein product [Brugia pahangi]
MKPKRASRTCRSVTPSKIDKCSRFFFPMLFFTFNCNILLDNYDSA